MLNLLQIVIATICRLAIILAIIIIKFIPIIIISLSLVLFLFAFLLSLRAILRAVATFLKFLVEKEE